jgi:RNA polymerase sigma factor (sigma-70 family)
VARLALPSDLSGSGTRPALLDRLRDGSDIVGWEEFFARYWPFIHRYARSRGCSEHTAEEVVQDVMLKVFRQKDAFQYDPSRGRFRDWLRRLVRSAVADRRRRRGDAVRAAGGDSDAGQSEYPAADDSPEDAWEDAFEQALLLVMLDVVRREMHPRAYLAFELSTLHGLSGEEVARHTGIARNGVYRACKRAIGRLRELGAAYRTDGQLGERLREAARLRPGATVQRSLTDRIERTMCSRREDLDE